MQHDIANMRSKRILVRGGARGIGEAIVERLARGGGKVIASARTLAERTGQAANDFAELSQGVGDRRR
jgi:NAD(P)-dependent dehydrogenase (short-subunit alcohol dehydrogenase family)